MAFTRLGTLTQGLFLNDTIATSAVVTVAPLDGGVVYTGETGLVPLVGAVPTQTTNGTTRFDQGNLILYATPGRYQLAGTINGLPFDAHEITIGPDPRDLVDEQERAADAAVDAAEVAAHLADAVDSHDATSVSFTPASGIIATDVQAALSEVALDALAANTGLSDHLADVTAAHAATAVSFSPSGTVTSTTVQAAVVEVATDAAADLAAHLTDAVDAHSATAISFVGVGSLSSTTVAGALAELDSDATADAAALTAHLNDTSAAHAATAVSLVPTGTIAATDVQGAVNELAADAVADAAALVAHTTAAVDAHDATAISVTPGFGIDATTVQAALVEVATDAATALSTHGADTTDAHSAVGVTFTPVAGLSVTNVQGAIAELAAEATADAAALADHLADTVDAHDASAVSFVPTGTVAATTVQAAVAEVATDAAAALAASEAAASATYASRFLGRPGNRWVALGDSIEDGATDQVARSNGESWPIYAAILSQQRMRLVYNAGVGGDQSSSMLARFATDVTAYAPNLVTIGAGTNDIGNGVPFATFKANIAGLVAACQAIGAKPVLRTIPPRDAGGFKATIVQWNAWLRYFAEINGLTILDFYRTLTDPATGDYIASFGGDGIHPSAAGCAALGEVAAVQLGPMLPGNGPAMPVDATEATYNVIGGAGLFLTAQGSGLGTGWTPGSAPTGVVLTTPTVLGVAGKVQRVTATASSGLYVFARSVATGFSVGDRLRVVGLVTSNGGVTFTAKGTVAGASGGCSAVSTLSRAVDRAVFCEDFTVPPGATGVGVQLEVGAGTGVVDFGQVGLYNLTTMGTLA